MDEVLERLTSAISDRYRIERELGRGGMGAVFLAEDRKHRRQVAIKILRSDLAARVGRERFLREIETSARLTHPHILSLHDSGEAGEFLYYVMPFVEGETLRDRLEQEGPLPVEEALRIATAVADALDYAHRSGVVHRDIKPENILFQDGHPVVADFGVARAVNLARGASLTGSGVAVGTPTYMSPEQVVGDPATDGRSDVYSLGCVLYEMLAGWPPFRAASVEEMVRQHLTDSPPPVTAFRAVSGPVADAVGRALAKSPADRFGSAREFSRALREASRAVAGAMPFPAWGRWTLAGVAALLTFVAAWVVIGRLPPEPASGRAITSIAVLPLENLSPDSGQEYFADGMTEAIITDLAQIGALKVISRTSVMQYKETRRSLREIARELGVDAVVEGTVLRAGPEVRITAQLVDASTDRHLWAASYQRRLENVLALQREIADAIAREVQVTLSPRERARLGGARAVNPDAYEAYLRGRYHWNRRTGPGFRAAIREFEHAVELDPSYAAAYSGLADSWILLVEWQIVQPGNGVPRAKAAALEALRRDSLLAEAHTSLAEVRISEWNWDGAESAFQRALTLNAGYPTAHQWYGYFLSKMGRHEEAIVELRKAIELDPISPVIHTELARVFWHARRYEDALDQLDRVASLDSTFVDLEWMRGLVLEAMGRYDEAIALYERSAVSVPTSVDMARAHAAAGRPAAGRRLLDTERERRARTGEYLSPVFVAEVFAALGQADSAFALLEEAWANGVDDRLTYLKVIPTMDPLRGDPRYQDLLRRLGL